MSVLIQSTQNATPLTPNISPNSLVPRNNISVHARMHRSEVLVIRPPGKPALTRWTSMLPAFAYLCIWQMIYNNIARDSMKVALKRPDVAETAIEVQRLLSDEGYRLREGAQLNSALDFLEDPPEHLQYKEDWVPTPTKTLIAVMTNSPIQHMCHILLDLESLQHRHPATARALKKHMHNRLNLGGEGRQALPMALELASCNSVNKCLKEGAQVGRS